MANEQLQAFLDQATQAMQAGQFQQALEFVEQAIAVDPSSSDAFVLKGICLSQTSQPEAAVDAFRTAVRLGPYNTKAYFNFAVHFQGQGKKLEALEMAREAAAVDPRNTAARHLMTSLESELAGPSKLPTGTGTQGADPLASEPPPSMPPMSSPMAPPPVASAPSAPSAPPSGPPPAAAPPTDRPASQVLPSQTAPPVGPPPVSPPRSAAPHAPVGLRPGYQTEEHSLPWVGNMGKAWVGVGVVLSVLSLVVVIGMLSMMWGPLSSALQSKGTVDAASLGSGVSALALVQLIVGIGSLLWMVFDILDRRANFWWIVLQVPCGCFGLSFLSLPIYMVAGRR